MRVILAIYFLLPLGFSISASSQGSYYTNVSQMPMFPGGVDSFHAYVHMHLKYPSDAIQLGKEGSSYISFVIDTVGKPIEIKCVKGLWPSCDQAAIDLFAQMPLWIPGKHQGKKVPVLLNVPIEFKLDQYFNRFISNGVLIYRDPKVVPMWFHKLPFDKWLLLQFRNVRDSFATKLPVTFDLNIKIDTTGAVMQVLFSKSVPAEYASVRDIFQWIEKTLKDPSSKHWRPAMVEEEKVHATYFITVTFK